MRLRCLTLCLVSLAASADSDAPEGPLTAGDLGVVTVVRRSPNVVLMRIDFDGDGPADAELRTGPTSSGCGDKLEDLDLVVVAARGKSYSARCCGP